MRHGFIRVAAATPLIRVGDCAFNAASICSLMDLAAKQSVRILVFPELSITGSTCGDLFIQRTLLERAAEALVLIADYSQKLDLLSFVGLPVAFDGKLYSCAAAVYRGVILGLVPKSFTHQMSRGFSPAPCSNTLLTVLGREVPFGTQVLFGCGNLPGLLIGVELGCDLYAPIPPSTLHSAAGATVIVNLSATPELIGMAEARRLAAASQSKRIMAGYIVAEAGHGESTTGNAFSAHNIIVENGKILAQSMKLSDDLTYSELDVERIDSSRRAMAQTFPSLPDNYARVGFDLPDCDTPLSRRISRRPFVPSAPHELARRASDILETVSRSLANRVERAGASSMVIGVSGGLDSTLALLACVRAATICGRDPSSVIAVTMPGFGTSDRTRGNALRLVNALGCGLREIEIESAVSLHFHDIDHDPDVHDIVYENAQARERAQILMDMANQCGGLHVGTGDMSELALGWTTYGGDHISMYNVNAGIPKTLVKQLVDYVSRTCESGDLACVLKDILECPISPELIPETDQAPAQRTEDILGPYELHDFFLYYTVRWGFSPSKIHRLAVTAFSGQYSTAEIKHCLGIFISRFFSQQYKRSCMPDCPRIGTVSLSPRGDWQAPSDLTAALWLDELDSITV